MSAWVVSRIGLPLSSVSTRASRSRLAFELVGDLVEDTRALLDGGLAPGVLGLVGGIQRQLDIGRRRARHLAELLAGDRAWIVEIPPLDRATHLAADEIVVAVADENLLGDLLQSLLGTSVISLMVAAPFWRLGCRSMHWGQSRL